jgi:hypothetical protein
VVDVEQAAQGCPQVNVANTFNLEIQPVNRALAQSAAVMEGSRIASGHRDILLITVNR